MYDDNVSKGSLLAIKIENWFTYHPPKGDQAERYVKIRDAAKEFALVVARCTPISADQTVAFRLIREAVMTANASIACEEAGEEACKG
jgi:hypothetical protein